jgi:hypothetical protein
LKAWNLSRVIGGCLWLGRLAILLIDSVSSSERRRSVIAMVVAHNRMTLLILIRPRRGSSLRYALSDVALRVLDPEQQPILWPEHFDVAILLDDRAFGSSPRGSLAGDSMATAGLE